MSKEKKIEAPTSERLFTLQIQGLMPLVCHNIEGMARMAAVEDKGGDSAAFERDHVEWWLYTDGNDRPVFPSRNIHKAYLESCRFLTRKPPGRMQSWAPLIKSAMLVMDDLVLTDWEPWSAPVKIGRSTVTRWRPRFHKWSGEVGVVVFDDAITLEVLEDLSYRVGRYSGLGDARSIGYGRCKITVQAV